MEKTNRYTCARSFRLINLCCYIHAKKKHYCYLQSHLLGHIATAKPQLETPGARRHETYKPFNMHSVW